ncbi:unnamed protein product [Ectocarpus sp. 13 AM-2016]
MVRRRSSVSSVAVLLSFLPGAVAQYDSCVNGTIDDIGNGRCDTENNNPSCGFDGGDCCSCTCTDTSLYSCTDYEFDCTFPDCGDALATSEEETCVEDWQSDGYCDDANNNYSCGYDGGDCCGCSCADSLFYTCGYNDLTCLDPSCFDPVLVAELPDCTGDWLTIGDGLCTTANNNPQCGYDGGDCCLCSCSGAACTYSAFECLDPGAEQELYECHAPPPAVLPCSEKVQQTWVVETSEHAQALAAAVNCSGGLFEVEWKGNAVVNDTIFVGDGTVLTVAGADSNAVIDGNAGTRLFTVVNAALHVSGVNISSGASVAGGAVAAAGSTLTFDRANFVGNGATAFGGAVYVSDGSIASCVGAVTFANNSAGIDGGALYARDGSTISCGASWLNNVAGDVGGAIRAQGGSTISWEEESSFAYNTAGRAAGALSVNNESSVSWNAATSFDSNTAGLLGGALHVTGGSSISWSEVTTFVRNSAAAIGGALAMSSSSKTSWSGATTYLGNEAGIAGGAMFVEESSNVSWSGETENVFEENLAGAYGGAAFVDTSSELSCGEQTTSRFSRNSAATYGGAIQVSHGSSLAFSGNTSFDGNSALGDPVNEAGTGHGGAVRAAYFATVTWSETTSFTNNTAVLGAGLYADNSSVYCLGHTIAAHNTATFGGGAFFFTNSSAVWDGQTDMYNNSAEFHGGAVSTVYSDLVFNGPTTVANNRVGDSKSSSGGAIYMLLGSSLFLSGTTTWVNNSAGYLGGAITMDHSTASWTGSTLFSRNSVLSTNSTGGAIHVSRFSSLSWSGATTFADNYSGRNAGALQVVSGEVSWSGVTKFVRNTADSLGGALFVASSRTSWSAATEFDGNSALSGASIFIWNSSYVGWTGDTEFISNEARLDGGVIGSFSTDSANDQGSTLGLNGTTAFVNNTCGANGGALSLLGGLAVNIDTENVSFVGNTAEVAGGAVFMSGTGFGPVFTGVRFISNSAQVGGAVSAVGSGNIKENADISPPNPTTFDRCHFIDNRATATGGAVDSAAGQDSFVNSTFQGNRAGTGGGLRLAGTASLDSCLFVDNMSDDEGGAAVSNIGSLLSVANISFSGNVFDCDTGMYLDYNASGNPFEAACSGCETACDGCFFEPPVPPTCTEVMEHVTSAGGTVTLEDLPVERGYWRASPSSEEVFACYNADACLGGVTGRAGYCLDGYEGPYCAVCSDGYTTELAFTCTRCSGGAGRIALAAVLAVVALCVAIAVGSYAMSGKVGDVRSGVVARLGRYVPLQSVKIVIVAWQILTQFTSVANVTYPDVYKRFLDGLDVFNFDLSWVLSAGCIFDIDYHDRLLASTISPLIGLLFLAGTYSVAASMNRGKTERLQVIWNRHVSLVLLLTFLIYSSVSATLFKAFACEELEDGTNYLRADYTIDCDSSKHKAFQVYAGLMTVLYVVGVPSFYAFLLFRDRHVLKDHHADREQTARTTSTSDLWKPYRPSVFYYEVIECGRRILLAGVVVFIFPNTAAQIAITLMMAFAFVMASEVLAPYASKWDAWLSRTGHAVVFVSMYIALLLKVDVSGERVRSQRVFENVLVAANACMILAVVTETLVLTWSLKVEQRQEPVSRFRIGKLFPSGTDLEPAQDDPFSADLRRVEVSRGR